MKKISTFLCILIIMSMTLSHAKAAIVLHSQQSDVNIEISKTKLSFNASRTDLPMDPKNQNIPEIKAASFVSSLPSVLYIHIDQEVVCIFEIRYEINRFNNYQSPIPVALTRFFLLLFEVIVSPNAP